MKKIVKFAAFSAFLTLSSAGIFAQAVFSTQSHEGKVNSLETLETATASSSDFYSAGNDGFVIKWGSDGMGEHYQISDLQIQKIARNPVTGDIAVYETDGISMHRVSVVDHTNYTKRFSKKFTASVTTVSFSEKGTYLFVGTTSVNGAFIINARTGSIVKRMSDVSGIMTMAKTGESEKTAVIYSKTGSLVYYDLVALKQRAKFSTEQGLEQPVVFGNGVLRNRFFAGTKGNSIYIIDATNGKIIAMYNAQDPVIFTSKFNQEESEGLYFVTMTGKTYSLQMVTGEILQGQLKAESSKTYNPPAPLIVKNFTGLKSRDSFTCGTKSAGTVMLGTKSGNIYTMTDVPESELYSLFALTENMYDKIYDINADGDDFFFLTADSILKTSYDSRKIERLGTNPNQRNIIKFGNSAILWTKNSQKAIQMVNLSEANPQPQTLFTPAGEIKNLRIYGNKAVFVQGTSSVGTYDFGTGKKTEVYKGTSVQDAALISDTTLYVAKSSTGEGDSPMISVNIQTGETLPLKFTGNVAYSLSFDSSKENSSVYGISLATTNGSARTEVFSYNPKTNIYTSIFKLPEEDADAFTEIRLPMIYTNIGKNQVRGYNIGMKKTTVYRRSASMPMKATCSPSRIAVLNYNGSISWYSPSTQTSLSDWYLTTGGEWFEF